MEKLKIKTRVNNGKLPTKTSELVREFIQSLEGKNIEIQIGKVRNKRSNQQNKYYWGCVVPIIAEALKNLGHRLNHDEVHYYLKSKFNSKPLCDANGEFIGDIAQSTAELTTLGFVEYIDKVVQWASEILSLQIPAPGEQIELLTE